MKTQNFTALFLHMEGLAERLEESRKNYYSSLEKNKVS